VPSLGVAGRFYTDATLSKSMDRALQIVEFLAGQVRSGR
jgi:thiol:disulfide interchange protein DsbA